jgi:predicted SprT family Zn-dependent metalloprotease
MSKKIKFKISSAKDVKTFFDFLNESDYDGGRNFEWAIFKNHPYFERFKSENGFVVSRKIVKDYVDKYYLKNYKLIEKNFLLFADNWYKNEKAFFKLSEEIFPNTTWPKGKYIAYSTIWGMYPRFLEDKTFQIPILAKKKQSINLIIAHELLHFLFFAYFLNKYKKYKSHKYDFFVWHVSEIFNSIILREPKWQKLLKAKNQDYPEHVEIISKLSNHKYSTEDLIEKIIKEVSRFK